MTRWEHQFLGFEAFPAGLSSLEVSQFFVLDQMELASVRKRRGANNHLAVALQVGFLKMTGGLLNSSDLVPSVVLEQVAGQLRENTTPPQIASIRALCHSESTWGRNMSELSIRPFFSNRSKKSSAVSAGRLNLRRIL